MAHCNQIVQVSKENKTLKAIMGGKRHVQGSKEDNRFIIENKEARQTQRQWNNIGQVKF